MHTFNYVCRMGKLDTLLEDIKSNPESVAFADVIDFVDASYLFVPTAFKNGLSYNEEGQNNGSCKVFAFAKLNNFSANETLNLFGSYYRNDVLNNPDSDDHQNIRNFIKFGWSGIEFEGEALLKK